jgi:hypothetical protein
MAFLSGRTSLTTVQTGDIATGAVTTAKIAANNIDSTLTKDALIADYSEVTIAAGDSILLGDVGDNGSTKRDTVQGILDLGGGAWNIIGTAEASASASVDVTGLDSTYDTYAIALSSMTPVDTNVIAWLRLGDSGGVDSGASDYAYAGHGDEADGTASDINSTGAAQIALSAGDIVNAAYGGYSGVFFLGEPGDDAMYSSVHGTGWNIRSSTSGNWHTLAGHRIANITHDRVQFLFSAGNIASGRMTVWGLAHA